MLALGKLVRERAVAFCGLLAMRLKMRVPRMSVRR